MLEFHNKNLRIGLDVDEVIAGFLEGYSYMMGDPRLTSVPHFNFSYDIDKNLQLAPESFWLNLPPKVNGDALPFLPVCYISRRSFSEDITKEWLQKNRFPCLPVIHVSGSKVDACRSMNLDLYVDDHINNFQELNEAGIPTLLMSCSHNLQYNVDPWRIDWLSEVPRKVIELNLARSGKDCLI